MILDGDEVKGNSGNQMPPAVDLRRADVSQ